MFVSDLNAGKSRSRGIERGVILASGLIAGEAIAGILIAVLKGQKIEMAQFLEPGFLLQSLTAAVLAGLAAWLFLVSRPRSA